MLEKERLQEILCGRVLTKDYEIFDMLILIN